MKISRLKAKDYTVVIGKNSLSTLRNEVKNHCPKCKKIAVFIDKKIPKKFSIKIKKNLIKHTFFLFPLQKKIKI